MRRFLELWDALDTTTVTNVRVDAMAAYFRDAPPRDAAWALAFLSGHRPKRLVPAARLRAWATEASGMEPWLVEESYTVVGDLAETIALILDDGRREGPLEALPLHVWVEERVLGLRALDEAAARDAMIAAWRGLGRSGIVVVNKLVTGGFRVGVSRTLVERAVAKAFDLPRETVTHRLMGSWEPSEAAFRALTARDEGEADQSRPYPFFLASPLEAEPDEALGALADWIVEWKWDGIRAQAIRRGGRTYLWSRGEELLEGRFPEIEAALATVPEGTVLDGEILAWRGDAPLPFQRLQQRIQRTKLSRKTLEEAPVVMLAYDLLEEGGQDLREQPHRDRRARLTSLVEGVGAASLRLSPLVEAPSWDALRALRETSRDRGVEGVMLKRATAPYQAGRRRGDWWKWKVDPFTFDGVLIHAQAGHGRRANLFTDYTFAVWDGDALVPVAKAYSGLSDAEIREVDRWVRTHTLERFGPVRSVAPERVFELAFEGIQRSSRHRSGIAMRFPRMVRIRNDKRANEADRIETLRALLPPEERDVGASGAGASGANEGPRRRGGRGGGP